MVKVSTSRLEWRKGTPIANSGDNLPIKTWFDNPTNRLSFFDATNEAKITEVWVPKLLYLPAELAHETITKKRTPWELFVSIHKWKVDRGQAVGEFTAPAKKLVSPCGNPRRHDR